MDNLINIQNEGGRLTVSSRQIAEDFEKEHKNVIQGIETLISQLGSAENSATLFIESKYQNEQNKQWYKEYKLTRDGFSLLVMGFTGAKALDWKLKYISAFNQMEERIKSEQPKLSATEMLKLQLQIMGELDEKVTVVNTRIDDVEDKLNNQMTIDYGKQHTMQKAVSKRVDERIKDNIRNGIDLDLMKSRKLFYPAVYRDLKDRFGVASYKDINPLQYDNAINYINNWIEPAEIRNR